jgi:hypothetical protein
MDANEHLIAEDAFSRIDGLLFLEKPFAAC